MVANAAPTRAPCRDRSDDSSSPTGTIFLDEVGELPLDMQVKLLRVLQEQEFEPVGRLAPVKVDVRVIAATNRDLRKKVSEKSSGRTCSTGWTSVRVPPLRERTADIPVLIWTFVDEFSKAFGKRSGSFSKEAWPPCSDIRGPAMCASCAT